MGSLIILIWFWIIISERFTIEGIVVGSIITAAVVAFNKESKKGFGFEKFAPFKRIKFLILYIIILLKEIVMANLHVAKIVLSRELKIAPSLVTISTGIKSDFNKVLFANSITLTPGTLTINLEGNELLIHCLEDISAKGLENPRFEKVIMEVEK